MRCRGRGIWRDISVVRFLPLSFYAKKKVAERKARIRGGGAKDARMREHMAAPVPPLMYHTLYLLQLLDYTWFVLSHKIHYVY